MGVNSSNLSSVPMNFLPPSGGVQPAVAVEISSANIQSVFSQRVEGERSQAAAPLGEQRQVTNKTGGSCAGLCCVICAVSAFVGGFVYFASRFG